MRQVLANLVAIAAAADTSLAHALKTTVFLTNLSVFPELNELYEAAFSRDYPARSTIEVAALPKGACVEIEAIVAIERKSK